MRYVYDVTGRFRQRPHYELRELEEICEDTVQNFLSARYGEVRYPLLTDDLTVLLEQEVGTLDLYADLSTEGEEVEGVTFFKGGAKPDVAIAAYLSEDRWRENRFRTTLSHELGHVVLHGHLWAVDAESLPLFADASAVRPARCLRANILSARSRTDWMEWQASFACGAFLMPASELRLVVRSLCADTQPMPKDPLGQELIAATARAFAVSADAARVRLLQSGYLAQQPTLVRS